MSEWAVWIKIGQSRLVSDRQGGAAEGAECWLLSHLALIYLCFRKISSKERPES